MHNHDEDLLLYEKQLFEMNKSKERNKQDFRCCYSFFLLNQNKQIF